MTVQKLFNIVLLLFLTTTSYAQFKSWSSNEKQYYTTMKSLCEYFKGKTYDTTQRDYVFKHFVYFDYVLADTSKTRIKSRVKTFDTLFSSVLHFIDSVGFENLDAKPVRYFKDNKKFYEPFDKGEELNELVPMTLAYFDKRRPSEPIGTLLFDTTSHKLVAWIILDQSGYHYFLTFNLFS